MTGLAAISAREFLLMVNLFTGRKRIHNTMWLKVEPSLPQVFQAGWTSKLVAMWNEANTDKMTETEFEEEVKSVLKVEFGHEYDTPDWAKFLKKRQ